MPVRNVPDAPAYKEAYPRLNIAAAVRGIREGRAVCAYERRRPIGHILCQMTPIGLIVDFEIIPDGHGLAWAKGEQGFKVLREGRTAVAGKLFILCPICTKPRQSVFFGRAWACAECQKLLRRSQVIPRAAGVHEQRLELRNRIGRGRPRGMHSRVYADLREKLAELDRLACELPVGFASEEHCRKVSEEWLPLELFQHLGSDPMSRWYRSAI